jgi:hypothetical protein
LRTPSRSAKASSALATLNILVSHALRSTKHNLCRLWPHEEADLDPIWVEHLHLADPDLQNSQKPLRRSSPHPQEGKTHCLPVSCAEKASSTYSSGSDPGSLASTYSTVFILWQVSGRLRHHHTQRLRPRGRCMPGPPRSWISRGLH